MTTMAFADGEWGCSGGAAGETTSRQRRQESSQIVSESFAKANSCKTAVSSFSLELFVCKARSHVAVVTIYANPFAMADSTGNLSGSGRLRRCGAHPLIPICCACTNARILPPTGPCGLPRRNLCSLWMIRCSGARCSNGTPKRMSRGHETERL